MWPHVRFYDRQVDVIRSVVADDMTVVPAGNMLGKDFVAGFIVVWYFLSRSPCRIVTTSAKDDHLRVLWGEIKRFIQSAKHPLTADRGGPLIVNHREIRRRLRDDTECPLSYIKGMVAGTDSIASMQGHHVANVGDGIPRTLFVADEASSVPDEYWTMARTWAKRALIIGNTWPCANFFYKSVEGDPVLGDPGGDRFSPDRRACYRRVIHIAAEDSPNVRLALLERSRGVDPTGRVIIPGVKDWAEYCKNRETWDKVQQCVSLDARFYKGAEVLLFPPEWLNEAARFAACQNLRRKMSRRTLGLDPGEGVAETSWCVCDADGLLHLLAMKTPNTADIPKRTIALLNEWDVEPADVLIDRGGQGKLIADLLREQGYAVRTVAFGEEATDPVIRRRNRTVRERSQIREEQYAFRNRRAEMYGLLSQRLDPSLGRPFGIPAQYGELRRQLAPIPKQYDAEGRLYLPPKSKRTANSKEVTLEELLGCSPDQADSLVLAVFGLERKTSTIKLGAFT